MVGLRPAGHHRVFEHVQPPALAAHMVTLCLQAIADQQYKQILANAFMDNQEWQCVAQRVLKLQIAHGSW
jgi:hypothetical protein